MFPDTPKTLIKCIAELRDDNDASEWEKFVEIYTNPLKHFVRLVGPGLSTPEIDDAVQDVFVKLVDVLRAERIDRTKGRFRDYLAAMTRRLLIDRYRAELVRPQPAPDCAMTASDMILGSIPANVIDPGAVLDIKWRLSVHNAAVEHVLTKTAISKQSIADYRALAGQSPKEVARQFGISYDAVKQVRSRIDRAVAAVESRLL